MYTLRKLMAQEAPTELICKSTFEEEFTRVPFWGYGSNGCIDWEIMGAVARVATVGFQELWSKKGTFPHC